MSKIPTFWKKLLENGKADIAEHEKSFFQQFLDITLKANRILEIGTGKGRFVYVLRKFGVKSEIVCLDINRYNHDRCLSVIGDARALPFKDCSFDVVFSLGVVEHFPETEKAILEHLRVLRKGGYMLITTPRLSIYTPLRWMFWFLKYRKLGSFQEVMGKNLTLNYFKSMLTKRQDVKIIACGVSGIFLPLPSKKLSAFLKKLPEDKFGAYLWIICMKV